MKIDTTYFDRCVSTLEKAHGLLRQTNQENIDYDMYRSACVKEFEIILEQSGKLLRKILKPYYHTSKEADKLPYKDIFRQAVLRSILSPEVCERWLVYRDTRNNTAHDYGVNFAEETLHLLPQFMNDARALAEILKNHPDDTEN